MKLNSLPKTTTKSKKRIGRGHGSGRGGHTSTRGTKGQLSRTSVSLFFEGTKAKKSLMKRLPLFRGKGKLKSLQKKGLIINLKHLASFFKANDEVTFQSLLEKRIIAKDVAPQTKIKILGDGEINIPLIVNLPVSKGAKIKIEKAGGKVGVEQVKVKKEQAVVEKKIKEEKPVTKPVAKKKTVKTKTKEK